MFATMRENPPPPYQRHADSMLMPPPAVVMKKPTKISIEDVKDADSAREYYNQAIQSLNKVIYT